MVRRANGTDYAGAEFERQGFTAHKLSRQSIVGKTKLFSKQDRSNLKEIAPGSPRGSEDRDRRSDRQLVEKDCRARAEEAEHRDAHCHRKIHGCSCPSDS
jgi:hypothetical protein